MKNSKKSEGAAAITAAPGAGGKTGQALTAKKTLPAKVRHVKDKLRGSIILGGTLHVTGPGILDRLRAGEEIRLSKQGIEFDLKASEGRKLDIAEANLWIDMRDSDVMIRASEASTDAPIGFDFFFMFEDGAGHDLEVSLSLAQARCLAQLLSAYLTAWEVSEKLRARHRANGVPPKRMITMYRRRIL